MALYYALVELSTHRPVQWFRTAAEAEAAHAQSPEGRYVEEVFLDPSSDVDDVPFPPTKV